MLARATSAYEPSFLEGLHPTGRRRLPRNGCGDATHWCERNPLFKCRRQRDELKRATALASPTHESE